MPTQSATTYRVLVSTDLGGDPDDIQSLIHLLHYSDILKLEGILSTAGPGSIPQADNVREWVRRVDLDHLREAGYPELMRETAVLPLVQQGALAARAPGPDGATDGSRWLIECAHAADPAGQNRPLWVLVWGSLTDVAQALHDDPTIADKIRIYYIGSTNTTNDPASRDFVFAGLADKWPGLWWIENGILPRLSHDTFRGYYQGGDQEGEWGNIAFIDRVIRGRGTDHNGEFAEKLGDAFPVATWPQGSLKEGDSPTFLYLLSPVIGGVGDVDDPTGESWGGQFRRPYSEYPNYYTDLDASAEECQATI
ncbi:MAG: DUF1593 domain-containing protein, partial [Caldilineaceae bacterium]|nr:DUF1593 domain-containing protein [Caldilineaceae bacterium]